MTWISETRDHHEPHPTLRELVAEVGLGAAADVADVAPLAGGVSSDIAWFTLGGRDYCAKFARAKLDTAADWHAPVERGRAECRHLGLGCGMLKVGAFARSERMAKWNEILRIESESNAPHFAAGEAPAGTWRGRNMKITHLDHLVITVADLDKTVAFYTRTLGMRKVVFGEGRVALQFGAQKINLHLKGKEFSPCAHAPTAGGGDFCLIADCGIADIIAELEAGGVGIELGPVARTGAAGPIESVYIRDPDMNLVEIAAYPAGRGPRIIKDEEL